MAGIGSGVLVPTRFVWPHGGKIVYLTGSFTGSVLFHCISIMIHFQYFTNAYQNSEHLSIYFRMPISLQNLTAYIFLFTHP